jgi:hyperosmotically inducible periplasmic protein
MKKIVMGMTAAMAALILTVPVAATAAQPDAWVTSKAKIALLTTEGVGATAVNVDTVDGRVTLHGKVRTEAEKNAAGDAVAKIEGAREVRNLLQVVPAKNEDKVEASDEQITKNVKDAFAKDRQLADSGINVQSVNKGVVLLAGETPSMTTHLRAVTAAAGVPGVRRVATEVKAGDQLADVEQGQDSRGVMANAKDRVATDSAKAGETMSDAYVTSKVKLRLLSNSETPALDINVDTTNGAVTLFGMVPTASAKAAAETEARKVDGVKNVNNDLQIVAEKKQEAVAAKDGDIKEAVEKAIERREAATGTDVTVDVKAGVVRLTGTVPNQDARVTAATAARGTPGVKAVLWEDLQIKTSKASANQS